MTSTASLRSGGSGGSVSTLSRSSRRQMTGPDAFPRATILYYTYGARLPCGLWREPCCFVRGRFHERQRQESTKWTAAVNDYWVSHLLPRAAALTNETYYKDSCCGPGFGGNIEALEDTWLEEAKNLLRPRGMAILVNFHTDKTGKSNEMYGELRIVDRDLVSDDAFALAQRERSTLLGKESPEPPLQLNIGRSPAGTGSSIRSGQRSASAYERGRSPATSIRSGQRSANAYGRLSDDGSLRSSHRGRSPVDGAGRGSQRLSSSRRSRSPARSPAASSNGSHGSAGSRSVGSRPSSLKASEQRLSLQQGKHALESAIDLDGINVETKEDRRGKRKALRRLRAQLEDVQQGFGELYADRIFDAGYEVHHLHHLTRHDYQVMHVRATDIPKLVNAFGV